MTLDTEELLGLIRPEIRALGAYAVPDPGDAIKLDAMENPYRLPAELLDSWLEVLRRVPVNRYPDPAARGVRERLRAQLDLRDELGVLFGNGSDELIQILALAVSGPQRVLLAPAPSFVMYRMISVFAGMSFVEVPLRPADYTLDMDAMFAAMDRHRPALVFLACPNNPTGNLWPREDVVALVERAPGLVVVDEAYAPFTPDTLMDLLGRLPNLLVMRTFSKMGLAGLRLGYLAGGRALLAEFDKLRLPYNINALTQASVEFALDHQAAFDRQAAAIRAARGELLNSLALREGITPYPSEANFILFRTAPGRAHAVFEGLRTRGVLIKDLSAQPMLEDCLRVTVGTPQENSCFIRALDAVLSGSSGAP